MRFYEFLCPAVRTKTKYYSTVESKYHSSVESNIIRPLRQNIIRPLRQNIVCLLRQMVQLSLRQDIICPLRQIIQLSLKRVRPLRQKHLSNKWPMVESVESKYYLPVEAEYHSHQKQIKNTGRTVLVSHLW